MISIGACMLACWIDWLTQRLLQVHRNGPPKIGGQQAGYTSLLWEIAAEEASERAA